MLEARELTSALFPYDQFVSPYAVRSFWCHGACRSCGRMRRSLSAPLSVALDILQMYEIIHRLYLREERLETYENVPATHLHCLMLQL